MNSGLNIWSPSTLGHSTDLGGSPIPVKNMQTSGHIGIIYLLHFDQPYKHARHYMGWAMDQEHLEIRLKIHRRGKSKVALMRAVAAAGINFRVTRTWEGTLDRERQLKNWKMTPRLCPLCTNGEDNHG